MDFASVLTTKIQDKNAQVYDQNTVESTFQRGDFVYVRGNSREFGSTQKLQNKYKVPYEIQQILQNSLNFVLQPIDKNARKIQLVTVHVSMLKRYKQYDPDVEESKKDFLRRNKLLQKIPPPAQVERNLTELVIDLKLKFDEPSDEPTDINDKNKPRVGKPVRRLLEKKGWFLAMIYVLFLFADSMEHDRPESTQPSSEPEMELEVHADEDVEFAETEESRRLVQPQDSATTTPSWSEVLSLMRQLSEILINQICRRRAVKLSTLIT